MMATAFPQHASNTTPYTMGARTTPSPPQSYFPSNASPQTPPSANQSPTSYHSHLHVRQLRPQKQPLYTPACLRPTENSRAKDIPGPRAPDTPPSSKQSSFDSGYSGFGVQAAPDVTSQESDLDLLRKGLSRAASEGLDEEYGDVMGPPTTAHWKVRWVFFRYVSDPCAFHVSANRVLGFGRCSVRSNMEELRSKDLVCEASDVAFIYALLRQARHMSRDRAHHGPTGAHSGRPQATHARALAQHIDRIMIAH